MEMEIIAWKAKMFDLNRKVECLGHKEKVLRNLYTVRRIRAWPQAVI